MFNIKIIPALQDNYIFLIKIGETNIVIDPGAAQPVLHTLGNYQLHTILITHHHPDHINGIPELVNTYNCAVIGYENPADAPKSIELAGEKIQILRTPGHTSDHISYYWPAAGVLFCGDTLFTGGCGRIFSGTTEQMYHSLQQIAQLPPATQIYSAHEYTVANYRFAAHYAPENPVYQARLAWAEEQRAKNKPTVPTTVAEEIQSNIFLQASTAAEFAAIRQAKDTF